VLITLSALTASRFVECCPLERRTAANPPRSDQSSGPPKALQMAVELATRAAGRHRSSTTQNPSTALRYSAAAGDATLGELAEWDPEFAEPFAPGALISASGLSERRDFPSK
jgi:hypothetical protein